MSSAAEIDVYSLNDDEFDEKLNELLVSEDAPEEVSEEPAEELAEETVVEEKETTDEVEDKADAGEEEPEAEENAGTLSGKTEAEGDDAEEEDENLGEADVQLKELLSPFKANGTDMQVKDISEARQLMQMGANYSKKMHTIKPHLRRVQTLEANQITDEDLNLLVDLKKGNKAAIKKLLEDTKVDSVDLDLDESDYVPTDYKVSQEQFELSEVMEEIQATPTYERTVDTVGNKWDEESRVIIAGKPEILRGLNNQMANGDFDVVAAEVERERVLGRLTGVNDLDAYVQTLTRLQEAAQAAAGNVATDAPSAEANQRSNGRTVDPSSQKRRKAKAAATSTGSGSKTKSVADVPDISKLTDADFEKQFNKMYGF